jgi:replicative DNA helicase
MERRTERSAETLLPQNIEAEQGVLGSIIIDPGALDKVVRFLRPEDFYRDTHRLIYESIVRVSSQHTPADFLTVCDDLERMGQLENVGGASYITSLINQVPTSGNVEYYGHIVERASILRRLIHVAGQIAALAYEYQGADIADALTQTEQLVFEISQRYLLGSASDISMTELMDIYATQLEHRYRNRGRITGVPTGYADLDHLLAGLQRSDLILLAARTSLGKTQFALNVAYNTARAGHRVGIFSLEMGKEQLAQRFVAMESRVEQQRLRSGWIEDEEWATLVAAMDRLAELGIYIDDFPGISLHQMRSRARQWVLEHGVELLIVDYLQLVTGENRRYETREQEVGSISRGLKGLARELNVPVLALAQLSRALETRQVKVPQLSDLRESGALEQDSDVVMFIYRDEVYNPETTRPHQADIIVAKQRNGPTGEIALYFNQSQGRFYNLDVGMLSDGSEVAFARENADPESDEEVMRGSNEES